MKCETSFLRSYQIKFIEFFSICIIIQIIFTSYFTHYVGNYYFFRIAYLVSQIMYQYRVFFYLFYLDLVKFELKTIKNELKSIATMTRDDSMENFVANRLKKINTYCQMVFQLSECMNYIFGWSNFTTILYCFHLPLTDGNWAMFELHLRSTFYTIGIGGTIFVVLIAFWLFFVVLIAFFVILLVFFSFRNMDDTFGRAHWSSLPWH